MKKWCFIGCLVFLLVACHKVDYSPVLSEIAIQPGNNPGFLSLQVASSSEEEVLNEINTSDFFDNKPMDCPKRKREGAHKDFDLYSCNNPNDGLSYNFYVDDSLLSAIELFTPGLEFEDIYQLFGPPTSLYTQVSSNEREIRGLMTMIYQDEGMVVTALLNFRHETFYLDEDVEVWNITLLPVEDVCVEEKEHLVIGDFVKISSEYLQEWNEFGCVEELYPNIYTADGTQFGNCQAETPIPSRNY